MDMQSKVKIGLRTFFGCAVLLLMSACGDIDMFDGDFGIQGDAKPELIVPAVYGSLSMWDVLDSEDNDYIKVSGDTLVFVYEDPTIINDMSVDEFFEVESLDIEIETEPITLPNVGVVLPSDVEVEGVWASTKIEFTDSVELCELDFFADYEIAIAETDFDYNLTITVDELYVNGVPFKREINGKAGSAYVEHTNMEFDARFVGEPIFHISYKVTVPAGQVISGPVALEMSLTNMDYLFAVGHFGESISATIEEDSFSMGSIDFLEQIQGSFSFLEPQVTLNLRTKGVGVPFAADLYMTASNKKGESATLELKDGAEFIVPGNGDINHTENINFVFNNQNSTIVEFISLPPVGDITYGGSLRVVGGDVHRLDTIWHTASVGLGVDVKIPFVVSAEGMTYSDTIQDISMSDVDMLESGTLSLILENEIPLALQVKGLCLLNKDNNLLADITPDGEGKVAGANGSQPGKSTVVFPLDNKDMEALCESEAIALDLVLSTNGAAVVKASQKLNFKIVVAAKADLSDVIE
ncbi:MAG: hypothetical protein IKC67_05260 [Odoribacter sp.]|nr:hypothetical protein [Odoribacter sp.]